MPIDPKQYAAWKALPEVVVKVSELSTAAYYALLEIRGSLPQAKPETMLEVRQATLGLSRAAQLALVTEGLEELTALGVVIPKGRDADGELQFTLYPKVRLVTELATMDDLKKMDAALKEAATDGLG